MSYASSFCSTRKLTWATKKSAKKYLARLQRCRRGNMRPYRCPECGCWHLGHRAKGFYQRAA